MSPQELTDLYAKMADDSEDAALQGALAGLAEHSKKNKSSTGRIKPETEPEGSKTRVRAV